MHKKTLRYRQYEDILNGYLNQDEFSSLSDLTIKMKRGALVALMNHLGDNGIYCFSDCQQTHITNHIEQINYLSKSTISGRLFIFRHFFNYLFQIKVASYSGNELFPVIFTNKRERVLSFYSLHEVKQVISSINRQTIAGKRDLAILLLAAELGIRSGDICRLKLGNIHWERGTIEFVQFKTKSPQQLPMPECVRFALIDYIANARPQCSCPNIFVGVKNGHSPLSNSCVHQFVSKYFKKAGIDISKRKHGPHALRHSLASNLLNNNAPAYVIKDILGHSNLNTTKVYLNIDIDMLKKIALEVPHEKIQ